MASPATTPPTIAPMFDPLLVTAAEVGVETAEVLVVGVVEVTEVGLEVTVSETVTEVGLVEVAEPVDVALVD